jgi:hypothetical protein
MHHMAIFMISVMPCLGMLGTGFWIWMLVHCWRNAKLQGNRTWWLLIIFFTHWIGAAAYFLVYVVPRSWWERLFNVPTPPLQQSTPYYQPSRQQSVPLQTEAPYTYQPYQSYGQGYQAQAPQYPSYPPVPSSPAMPQEEQTYSSADYEQPQTMYPELPPQQQ